MGAFGVNPISRTPVSDSALAQRDSSFPLLTRPKDERSLEGEGSSSPSLDPLTQAQGVEEEDGWAIAEQLYEVIKAADKNPNEFTGTDQSIIATVQGRVNRKLTLSPAMMSNFEGIFSKALALNKAAP